MKEWKKKGKEWERGCVLGRNGGVRLRSAPQHQSPPRATVITVRPSMHSSKSTATCGWQNICCFCQHTISRRECMTAFLHYPATDIVFSLSSVWILQYLGANCVCSACEMSAHSCSHTSIETISSRVIRCCQRPTLNNNVSNKYKWKKDKSRFAAYSLSCHLWTPFSLFKERKIHITKEPNKQRHKDILKYRNTERKKEKRMKGAKKERKKGKRNTER